MNRRSFLTASAAAGASVFLNQKAGGQEKAAVGAPFRLKYAPGLSMFKHHAGNDVMDQLEFIADTGFGAFFDNGLMGKTVKDQENIAQKADALNLTIGPFVAYADFGVKSFVTRNGDMRAMLIQKVREAAEVRKRTGCRWALVVPGAFDANLEWEYQTANVIENLRYCAQEAEKADLVLVLEPLNPWRDHPGLFLTRIPQAFQICEAVNSPSVKILNDIYHQQITEGNLIPNIERSWNQIAAFHVGDTPGRKEPGTGEINYKNIFKYIHGKGYDGVLCMEHGLSRSGIEGERALIEAYRACDSFE